MLLNLGGRGYMLNGRNFLLVVASLIVFGCDSKSPIISELLPPLSKVMYQVTDDSPFSVSVWAGDGVNPEDLVDLRVFDAFMPGINEMKAKRLFGKPDRMWRDNLFTYYSWNRDLAEVRVVKEERLWSALGSPPKDWEEKRLTWHLYALPHDGTSSSIFHSSLMPHWNKVPPGKEMVLVINGNALYFRRDVEGDISLIRRSIIE